MAGYVTSQPHSQTNPTSKYRVVEFSKWLEAMNGGKPVKPVSVHETFDQAAKECGKLNRPD